jgi:hypothetical protein
MSRRHHYPAQLLVVLFVLGTLQLEHGDLHVVLQLPCYSMRLLLSLQLGLVVGPVLLQSSAIP